LLIETLEVPRTAERALDPEWLGQALASLTGGAPIEAVEQVEYIRTVATKIRFTARWGGETHAFCIKGLLDVDEMTARGGPTMLLEADFYGKVAATVDVRVPTCVAAVVDRANPAGVILMRDVIAEGGTFCSALDAFTPDQAAASLEQLAHLHVGKAILDDAPWIGRRVASLANANYVTPEKLQELLDGPRGDSLPARTKNAATLKEAMKALAALDETTPDFLLHGDAHAGNIFRNAGGTGVIDWQLLQRGGWALDVAYHVCAVLPVEVAEAEERRLLGTYLQFMRGLGAEMPDAEEAWRQYRLAAVYGYYLWSITQRVDPAITLIFNARLGASVTRHDSYGLLGL
jgi:hypothetical protein